MRRAARLIGLIGVAAGAVTACSSDGDGPSPSPTKRQLTVDERLRVALLTPATLEQVRAAPVNAGTRFDPTENTTYAFVTGCGATLAGNARIDGEWQASFYGNSDVDVDGDQVAVHYRSGAAAALAEVRSKLNCSSAVDEDGNLSTSVTAPQVDGVFTHCLTSPTDVETRCQLVAAADDFALGLSVYGSDQPQVLAAVGALGPVMRRSIAGNGQATATTPSSSAGSTSAAPPAGLWTKAVARERFAAMLSDRQTADSNRRIDALLRGRSPNLEALTSYADGATGYDRIVAANLGAGRWPTSAAAAIAALRAALTTERQRYRASVGARSVTSFQRKHKATLAAVTATEAAIAKVNNALAGN